MDLALKGFGGSRFAQWTLAEVPGGTAQNKRWVLAPGVQGPGEGTSGAGGVGGRLL